MYIHVYVYSVVSPFHVTTHKFKRREEDDDEGEEKGEIILFLKQLIIRQCLAAWLQARI